MEHTIALYEHTTSSIEALFPSPLPVPELITVTATALSEYTTSSSFPYRINYVNLGDVVLWQALIVCFLHPCIWNIIGRFEYSTRLLSFIFMNPRIGTYALAAWITLAGLYRDILFVTAMERQVTLDSLGALEYRVLAFVLTAFGMLLVFSSTYHLGIAGTFLGDYFGILLENRITKFPFNILDDPMYDGTVMVFLGKAIM